MDLPSYRAHRHKEILCFGLEHTDGVFPLVSWLWTKANDSRTHRVGEDGVQKVPEQAQQWPGPTDLGDF